jgi:hypothetical protein
MKAAVVLLFLVGGTSASIAKKSSRGRSDTNPLAKTIELLSSLEAKIVKEGEEEAKAYKEYIEWCDDAAANLAYEIKTLTSKKEELTATIAKASSDIEAAASKIEELAGAIAAAEGELKDATAIREKEHEEFVAAEHELVDAVDTLDRAISIIEREMAKNPALVQVDVSNIKKLEQGLSTVLDAAAFGLSDKKKLLGLIQSQNQQGTETLEGETDAIQAEEREIGAGAPDPAAYKSHSSSIVDVLEDLKDKAETELSDLRKAETSAAHNFNMLKTSLEDQLAYDSKSMDDEKAGKAAAEQEKATAEGDLAGTVKDLAEAEKGLGTAQTTCMSVAADHEATVRSRAEELAALAKAKQILSETTSGAVEETYSLLEEGAVSTLRTHADLANAEIVNLVKKLAKKYHSTALSQLASKISTVVKYGAMTGEDPFAKVKGLIMDLITRLEKEAAAEASEKAYCDEQMAKTEAKKSELEDDIAALTAKIDKAAAASARLKEEVKELQAELAALAKSQAEMDKIRGEERAAYVDAKADLELGLGGVRRAIDALKEYYGGAAAAALVQSGEGDGDVMQQPPLPEKHEKASGAGGGIIDILEVVEADFAKNLAAEETQEADAAATYDKTTQENKVTAALKEQDVKYKTGEFKGLDKSIAELSSDKETANTEQTAVLEYYAKIKDRCIAKAETYEEQKRRREAEIAGLKEALSILSGEALLQGKTLRR